MLKLGFIFVAISAATSGVRAQDPPPFAATPLISKHFPSPSNLPYQVDTDNGPRGPQKGYNICNSTTENQNSLCQTFYMNNIEDFCITAPPEPGKAVADQEGEMVAWCSKKGHGTRLIPKGAILGIEVRKTPDYMQFVGYIDQPQINIPTGDSGGEMDSGGADGRGNPKGAAVYSNAWTGSDVQAIRWTCFMGGDMFGCKACDPSKSNDAKNCEHIYDRIGIFHNMPHLAEKGKYVACEAPSADFPGVYTQNGQVMTYTQPDEKLGAINGVPYTPTVPAASKCTTYSADQLYKDGPTGTVAATKTGQPSGTGKSNNSSGSQTSSGSSPSNTSGAISLSISAASMILSIGFATVFLA